MQKRSVFLLLFLLALATDMPRAQVSLSLQQYDSIRNVILQCQTDVSTLVKDTLSKGLLVQNLRIDLNKTKEELGKEKKETGSLSAGNAALKASNKECEKRKKELDEEIKGKERKIKDVGDALSSLKSDAEKNAKSLKALTHYEGSYERLRIDSSAKANTVDSLKKIWRASEDKYNNLLVVNGTLSNQKIVFEGQKNQAESKLSQANGDNEDCRKNLAGANRKIDTLKAQNLKFRIEISAYRRTELEGLRKSLDEVVNGSTLTGYEGSLATLRTRITRLEEFADADMKNQLDQMKNQISNFESACQMVAQAKNVLGQDYDKASVEENTRSLSNIRTSNPNAQKEIASLKQALGAYCSEYRRALDHLGLINDLRDPGEKRKEIRLAKSRLEKYPHLNDQFAQLESNLKYKPVIRNVICN